MIDISTERTLVGELLAIGGVEQPRIQVGLFNSAIVYIQSDVPTLKKHGWYLYHTVKVTYRLNKNNDPMLVNIELAEE